MERLSDGRRVAALIEPHPGGQREFVNSTADISIFGGIAGAGKTHAAIASPIGYLLDSDFHAFKGMIMTDTYADFFLSGGLHDEITDIYAPLGGEFSKSTQTWVFGTGAKIGYGNRQNLDKYKKVQLAFLMIEQVEEWEEDEVFFMQSRLRTKCPMQPIFRATCNPYPHWLADYLEWWIDDDGFAIDERSGAVRYCLTRGAERMWASDPSEFGSDLRDGDVPVTVQFIKGSRDENPTLDPLYEAKRLDTIRDPAVRARLKDGNWKVRSTAGSVFRREWFGFTNDVPSDPNRTVVRYWDLSSGKGDAFTVGLRASMSDGVLVVEDVVRGKWTPFERDEVMERVFAADGVEVNQWVEVEPGGTGIEVVNRIARRFAGYTVKGDRVTGKKHIRWEPVASLAENDSVVFVAGKWNEPLLNELENAAQDCRTPVDQADCAAGALKVLTDRSGVVRIGGMRVA